MSVALVTHAAAYGLPTAITPGVDTTGANLIVLYVYGDNPGGVGAPAPLAAVTDSKGNVWVACDNVYYGSLQATFYFCVNPVVGAGHTFTTTVGSPAGCYVEIAMQAFSGVDSDCPFEQQVGQILATSGVVTPFYDGSLVVTGYSYVSGAASIPGFTITDNLKDPAHFTIAMAYQIQTTATPVQAVWSPDDGHGRVAMLVFRAASAPRPKILPVAMVTAGTRGAPATTLPIDTTGATLIVASGECLTVGAPGVDITLTDSFGNTWVELPIFADLNALYFRLFYCLNPTVGPNHTFTISAPTANTVCVGAFKGNIPPTFGMSFGALRTYITPNVTPAFADSLVIGAFTYDGSFTDSVQGVAAPYGILVASQNNFWTKSLSVGLAYRIMPVPGPTQAVFAPATDSSTLAVAEIANFFLTTDLTIACPVGGGTARTGIPYDEFPVFSGGAAPYTFAIASGALPPGLSLNEGTGEISGTPTQGGTFNYVLQITDANGNTAHT